MRKPTAVVLALGGVVTVLVSALFLMRDPADSVGAMAHDSSRIEMERVSTRIKWLPYASYIGTYVAKDWNIWTELRLDVKIMEGGPQVDAIKLVAVGSNDFGIAGGDQLIVARSKGLPVVAIAALMQETPAGFMVHDDSDIQSMSDFPGHTIRIIPGHNTEIEFRAVMSRLGIDPGSVREVVNFSELQLFLARKVDIEPIYLNNQPATARARGVKFRIFSPPDYGIHSYGNVYFTHEDTIRDRPELVQRFLEGILQGWTGAFADPERAVNSLIKYAPTLSREVELEKLAATKPLMAREDGRTGWMEHDRWNEIVALLLETKVISEPIDVDAVYDNRFVKAFYQGAKE